jgi:hypothetical protein
MKKLSRLAIFLATFLVSANLWAADATVSMAYTNALGEELPFAIFSKGNWSPDPKARYVKLHLYFDEPIKVQGLSIDSCGSKLTEDLSIFFNFDQWVLRIEPDLEGEMPRALYPKRQGNLLVFGGFKKMVEVRSLTFNFESNSGFRICGIQLKDPKGEIYKIKTPQLIDGTVTATSVLEPATAYDPIFLFDSRFEYGWASNQQAKDVSLDFNFGSVRRVERIRIWNGYQRSITHCFSNSRAKAIRVTGDGDYNELISIKDILGSQIVVLPKPFEGTHLRFEVADSFLGKTYKDLVISELRFFDGKDWFMLDPSKYLKDAIALNREQFKKAHVAEMLNDSYTAEREEYKEKEGTFFGKDRTFEAYYQSTLRLRADGSFYLSGTYENNNGVGQYFTLGNYEIKDANPVSGIKLRLFGLYYESSEYGDCNGCGRDCNKNVAPKGVRDQKIFQEFFTIKAMPDGKMLVVNQSGGKKVKFDHLEMKREVKGP